MPMADYITAECFYTGPPLLEASMRNDLEFAQLLLDYGAHPNFIAEEPGQDTPLTAACADG